MHSWKFLLLILVIGGLPAVGFAAAAGPEAERELIDPRWQEALYTIIVFLIFFGVLSTLVWPRILEGLRAREQKQREDLATAERAARDATATLEQYQQQLAEAQKKAQEVIDESRAQAQRVAQQLREDVDAEIQQMRSRAESEIVSAKQQALSDVHAQIATLATEVAGQILHREIRPEDQQSLVDESLSKLTRSNN